MTNILIRRSGNLIELSADGKTALQPEVRALIEPHLSYMYKRYLRGPDRKDFRTGLTRGPFIFEPKQLFRYDATGRLIAGVGFLSQIKTICAQNQILCSIANCDVTKAERYKEDWPNVVSMFEFRPKQDDCLVAVAGNENGIICAPTGFGKGTLLAMIAGLYNNSKIHIVTPSKDLVEKTVRYLSKYLPNIGQVGAGKKQLERITVFSADSLHLSNGDADILLCDEIHKLAAPSYATALAKYRNSRNFGFSATPTGRADGADKELESLFGPVIFSLSYEQAVELKLVAPIKVEWLDVKLLVNPCADKADTAKKRWGIWRNDERNRLIADKALSYGDDQVLILVETIEHLMFLRKLLPGFESCYSEGGIDDETAGKYRRWGLMEEDEKPITAQQRAQLRAGFEAGTIRKAIATSVWATGVDFIHLAVLMRADALSSEIMDVQAPGRVSRMCAADGKEYGTVIDCLDQFDEGFRKKAVGRRKTYQKNGWTQILPTKRKLNV